MSAGEVVGFAWLGCVALFVPGWWFLRVKWTPVGWRFAWRRDVGLQPIPPLQVRAEQIRLAHAKRLYVEGEISLERFEELVEVALRDVEQRRGPVAQPSPFLPDPGNRSSG